VFFVVPRNCASSSTANWTRTILPPKITTCHDQGPRKNVSCFVLLVFVYSPEVFIVFLSSTTVKCHVKALGLYNFGWAYKRGRRLISGEGGRGEGILKIVSKQRDKTHLNNELKFITYHYILSYYPITLLLPY